MDEGIAMVRDEVLPAVTGMNGCLGLAMLADRSSGEGIVTTSWESREAMQATAEAVAPMRERASALLGGDATVQEWEISVAHRHRPTPEGGCTRTTWLRMSPEGLDRVHDVFRFGVLPKAESMPGFCSAVLMVDRDSGLTVSTVAFEDRASVEATRDAAQEIRTTATAEIGAEILDVREHELVLAHLHVPEMA